MRILGINCLNHDAAISVIEDRKIIFAAHSERYSGTKVCLFPVRANTKWWAEVCVDSEIRFINGEVNFNDEPRGLWAAMCIMIFGEQAKTGTFSVIDYRNK